MTAWHFVQLALYLLWASALAAFGYSVWRLRNVNRAHRQRMILLKSIESPADLADMEQLTYQQHIAVLMRLGNPWRSYGALGARVEKETGRKA